MQDPGIEPTENRVKRLEMPGQWVSPRSVSSAKRCKVSGVGDTAA
jgi:hypothetical protein